MERVCGRCKSPNVPEKNAHPRGGDCSSDDDDEDEDEDEDEDKVEDDDDKAPAEALALSRESSKAETFTLVSKTLESESAIASTGSMSEAAKSRILGENIPSASPP